MADDIVPGRDPVVDAALTANHREFRHFLIRRLGNIDDAEDVLQQFYLRALSSAGSLRKGESVVAWLYRLLHSALTDYTRREALRRPREAAYAQHVTFTCEAPELHAAVCTCLYTLLPTLQPAYADLLWRVDLLGEPRRQVATDLGLTVNNLTVRLYRARQSLKRALLLSCQTCPEHGFLQCECVLPLRRWGTGGPEQDNMM